MVSDSARGIALWFIVLGALLYGVVNTVAKVKSVLSPLSLAEIAPARPPAPVPTTIKSAFAIIERLPLLAALPLLIALARSILAVP